MKRTLLSSRRSVFNPHIVRCFRNKQAYSIANLYNNQYQRFSTPPNETNDDNDSVDPSENSRNFENVDWISRYNEIIIANQFPIAMDSNYLNSYICNTMYGTVMNLQTKNKPKYGLTQLLHRINNIVAFSSRFCSFEEFIVGSQSGFQFIIDSLEGNDLESIKECLADDIYTQINDIKSAILEDNQYKITKIQPYLIDYSIKEFNKAETVSDDTFDDETENEGDNDTDNDADNADTNDPKANMKKTKKTVKIGPFVMEMIVLKCDIEIDITFDVRYYCLLQSMADDSESQKCIDVQWCSKWILPAQESDDTESGEIESGTMAEKARLEHDWTVQKIVVNTL